MKKPLSLSKVFSIIGLILIGFGVWFRLFAQINQQPLERWDEATNYWVISESLDSANPLELKLAGQPFLEKPPLFYYAAELSVVLFGETPTSMRLVSIFSAIGIIILIFLLLTQRFNSTIAILGILIFLSIDQLFVNNPGAIFATHTFRSIDLDPLQIFLIFWAFYLSTLLVNKPKYLYLIGLIIGAAVLVKGFFALLPGTLIYIFVLINRKKLKINWRVILISIGLCLLMFVPWHLWQWFSYKSLFVEQYFLYHVVNRTLTPLEGHNSPWWYYFNLFTHLGFNKLWSLEILAISFYFKKLITDKIKLKSLLLVDISRIFSPENWLISGSLIITIFTVVAFTLVATKLSWYILPIYPFICLITASFIGEFARRTNFLSN